MGKVDFYDGFKRGAASLLVGLSLLGLGGCATTGSHAESNSNIGYEKFFDSQGDYKLVGRNSDIYMEKIDGSESRQVTHTPDTKEGVAFFSKDRKYILYVTYIGHDWLSGQPTQYKYYRITRDDDDSNRVEISSEEYSHFEGERFR